MMHTFVGQFGHFAILAAFVSALITTFAWFRAATLPEGPATPWRQYARGAFVVHTVAVLAVVGSLYWIIYNHYFEYHYAWSNASKALPAYYVISSFWQDQEGSFLLWIFWQTLVGLLLIRYFRKRKSQPIGRLEAPALAVFGLVQAFLTSMILGIVMPGLNIKIGSSPFLLLREANPEWPVWQLQPNFVPEDGNGLNPLLQNPWMVIHPPTLFLGFALTLVPFALAVAGLWRRQFTQWVRPALPWTALGVLVLGTGILMGAIWAYETLNFGGYWNWDPVENAVYVPWLVLVASLHAMLLVQGNKASVRVSALLVIAQFVLILYSTFLTRSGVLGNASVHSFTDLGLSGQLLLYLLTFLAGSVGLLVYRWKQIPSSEKELTTYSRDFWVFLGITVLCLAGFQVIATTSIPAYNALLGSFGVKSNVALPADQVQHYTRFQLWFFVLVVILNGIGQYFWWGKATATTPGPSPQTQKQPVLTASGFSLQGTPWEAFSWPLILTFLLTTLALVGLGVGQWNWVYILLLLAAVFSLVTNGATWLGLLRKKALLMGGSLTHMGVALMLLGILFSAGYSKVVTENHTGLLISEEASTQENAENQVLWVNQPQQLDKFLVTYKGKFKQARQVPGYLPESSLLPIEGDFRAVARQDITADGRTYYKAGDTLAYFPENTYYQVEYREASGRIFNLYPRVQVNPRMGNAVSPAIRHELSRDVYTHITQAPLPGQEREWSKTETLQASVGDTLFLNDFVAVFSGAQALPRVEGVALAEGDAAVEAIVDVFEKNGQSTQLRPVFYIKNRLVGLQAAISDDLGLRLQLATIDPRTGRFTFNVNTTQRDYIVMKALEKPYINLLWLGTGLLVIGLTFSTVRRFRETA